MNRVDQESQLHKEPPDPETATLGQIDHAWKTDRTVVLDQQQLWSTYDARYGWRTDYRIWRTLFRSENPSELSSAWLFEDMVSLAERELTNHASRPAVNTWSILTMASGILTRKTEQMFSDAALDSLANAADYALANGLAPLREFIEGCALVRVFAICAIQSFRYRQYGPMSTAQAGVYVSDLVTQFETASPGWFPGKAPWLDEAVAGVFPFPPLEMTYRATRVLYSAHFVVDASARKHNEYDTALMHKAAQLAESAWKLVRAMRMGIEKYQKLAGTSPKFRNLALEEMRALRATCSAIRNAGHDLGAANLSSYLLRVIPDYLVRSKEFLCLGTALSRAIREAGLEVDSRFLPGNSLKQPVDVLSAHDSTGEQKIDSALETDVAQNAANLRSALREEKDQIFVQRLAAEQRVNEDWGILLAAAENGSPFAQSPAKYGLSYLQKIVDVRRDRELGEDILNSAFRLLLRYGKIQSASRLLARFWLSEEDLFLFLSYLQREVQMAPFAMNESIHRTWIARIKNILDPIRIENHWSEPQRILLHEALLGTGLSTIQAVGAEGARILTRKLYGELTEEELRDLYDDSPLAIRQGPKALNPRVLENWIQTQGNGSRTTTFVSVISMGSQRSAYHIMVLLPTGQWRQRVVILPDLRSEIQELCRSFSLLRLLGDITIPPGIRALVKAIVDEVPDARGDPSWLLPAVAPKLASLPWQNLIMRHSEGLVVSLVPNLSWAVHANKYPRLWQESVLQMSNAPDLAELNDSIRASWFSPSANPHSMAVVLGHGKDGEGAIPAIFAGKNELPLTFENWLDIAQRRITVVHSCFGASRGISFLGSFGGLPALALGLGCRLFCAPVAEVPLDAAAIFQQFLSTSHRSEEFGVQYLRAIQRNSAVSLYNLYGLPYEPLYPAHSEPRNVTSTRPFTQPWRQ